MKIVIETNTPDGREELCRYSADVCPRKGETVTIKPTEDDEIKTWDVVGVDHYIAPNYEIVTVLVSENDQ